MRQIAMIINRRAADGPGGAADGPGGAADEPGGERRVGAGGGTVLPTVAEVLALDGVRRGGPRVVAGTDRLGTRVRWVHAIELADAARLLRGGELVLTTGIALPDEGPQLDAYVAGLASVGVAGLAVELVRRYTGGLPASFVAAAGAHRPPPVVFPRRGPFVEVTEAGHAPGIGDPTDPLSPP